MTHRLPVLGLLAALFASGCVSAEPVPLSDQFVKPATSAPPKRAKADTLSRACTVRIADVRDTRGDVRSMGEVGGRAIHAEDSVGWLRSSLQSLDSDALIEVVEQDGADVEISVDLLKAYLMTITQVKTATVVAKVRYSTTDEAVYRGTEDSINWWSADGEAQGALNHAMARMVDSIRPDLIQRCKDRIGA